MAAQTEGGSDMVTVCTDASEQGTWVRVVAARHIRMVDLMPVFEALDLNLVSYTAEPDPDVNGHGPTAGLQAPLARRKQGFRGRFLVTDAEGQNLSDALLDALGGALQDALHVRLSRPTRCSLVNQDSRRCSMASYATEASIDPDSPSFAASVAAHQAHGHPAVTATSTHSLSHLHPGPQCFSTHQPQIQAPYFPHHQYPHHHQHQQPQPHPHPHYHDHTASTGSMLFSDQSVSSISSLLRATSGAVSDHPTVPSPSTFSRHDTATFTFLQQQPSDAVFIDTLPQGAAAAVAAAMAAAADGGGCSVVREEQERHSGGPTTPFASLCQQQQSQQQQLLLHHYQHSRSQPHVHPALQAYELFEVGGGPPGTHRVSSACSTPPNISGPLPILPTAASPSPQPDSASEPVQVPMATTTSTSAPTSGPGVLTSACSRSPHVSFLDPHPHPVCTAASAAAASNTTPVQSRSQSASQPFLSTTTPAGSLPPPSHPHAGSVPAGLACAAVATTVADAAFGLLGAGSRSSVGDGTSATDAGDAGGSPTSSSDEREGAYTWWSTLTAQDTVARIMSHPARTISAEADLGQAKSLMTKHNISALLVNTGGPSPGFITKRDFLKVQFSKHFKRTKVKDVMTQPVIFVEINLPIEQCSRVLEAHGVRRVLVHDPSRASQDDPMAAFVGVVSDADLFKCMGAPAMSPVVGSVANSAEHAMAQHPTVSAFAGLASGAIALPPLPSLPSLPSLTSSTASQLPLAPSGSQQPSLRTPQHTPQPCQHTPPDPPGSQTQQPLPLSSVASTASISNSGGPSHAASMAAALSVDATSTAAATTAASAAAAACSAVSSVAAAATLALAGSGGSMVRLNAEASLADRYRCAAALWELDFNELEAIRRIGEGSFGEVLLANFRGTKVAVKRLRGFDVGPDNPDTGGPGETGPSPTQMPIFRQFFEREIEILATIRHPNVVNFIGACHTPPNVCLVTEYCARGSLDHLLHKSSITLDLLKKVEFSMDIARGMSCLHSQKPPIIHRDLKTANLLVSARFEVKVADFGLSRIKDHAQLINSRAGLEGTVEYAAPEVLRGEPYTEKCDIWSYAVLLWEIIHRQRPYADADVPIYILMMSLGNGTLRLPPVREDAATAGLARLVDRCMAWHPTERPSFREVLHALEAEYKILRGKAAAVPRSDSASSMMVLPGMQQNRPHTGGAPDSASSAHYHQQQHPPVAANTFTHGQHDLSRDSAFGHTGHAAPAAAGGQVRPGHPQALQPQPQPARAPPPARKSSKLGLNPHSNDRTHAGDVSGEAAAIFSPGGGRGGGRVGMEQSAFAADASGDWRQDPPAHYHHQHHQHHHQHQHPEAQQPQREGRPRVKLTLPQPHHHQGQGVGPNGPNGTTEASDPTSPPDTSRPGSSRTAFACGVVTGRTGHGGHGGQGGHGGYGGHGGHGDHGGHGGHGGHGSHAHAHAHGHHGGGGGGGGGCSKPGSAGRPMGRSLRSAARSKSMPLPELEWLAGLEEGLEEYFDTTESVADEEDELRGSRTTSASGVAPVAGGAPHPLDRGGAHSTPCPDAATLRPVGQCGADVLGDALAGGEHMPHDYGIEDNSRGAGLASNMGTASTGATSIGRSHVNVSAFAAAAAMAAEEEENHEDREEEQGTSTRSPWCGMQHADRPQPQPHPLVDERRHVGMAPNSEPLRVLAAVSPAPAAICLHSGGPVTSTAVAAAAAALRQSPFHMASSSPFADAADLPWSPRNTRADSTSGPLPSPRRGQLPGVTPAGAPQQHVATVSLAAPPPSAHRAALVSPFAQLAYGAPSLPSQEGEVGEEQEEEVGARDEEDRRQGRANANGSSGGATSTTAASSRPTVAAPSTANSTDVITATEKDQHAPEPDLSWALIGACSKPPSGDVYSSNGAVSRLSPSARPPSPPTLAAVYAAAQQALPVGACDDDATAVVALHAAAVAAAGASEGAAAGIAAAVLAATGGTAAARQVGEEVLHAHHEQMVLAAAAGLDALSLGLPDVSLASLAYGNSSTAGTAVGVSLESGQFSNSEEDGDDEEDEDAALHTTAWVRL